MAAAPPPVVLVLEDDASVQAALCATLTRAGFNPIRTQNIEEALTVLGTTSVDALLLDVRVPDPKGLNRSGFSLLSYVRTITDYRHLPITLFTGVPLSDDERALVRRHRARLFLKPEPYSALVKHLNRCLLLDQASGVDHLDLEEPATLTPAI